LGRYDEAIAEMRKAENLDPLSLIINADLAELLVLAHSYDESIEQSRKTIEVDPNFASHIINWPRRTCKKTCTLKRSQNCKKRFSFLRVAQRA